MKQEQTKAVVVNILTAVVLMGVLVAGYFVFMKKEIPVVDSVASTVAEVAKIAEETALIGTEIDFTVRDLGELASAVASSNVIFDLPAFKNLRDFSVSIPTETVGRTNPFTPTEWKLKLKAIEDSISGTAQSENTSPSQVEVAPTMSIDAPPQTPATVPEVLTPGI